MKQVYIVVFLFFGLSTFGQIANTISPAEKVYGLSKFWQEVNYNFVYLEKVDRIKWDNRYKELITIVQNTQNDYEYYRELQKFCALLKDGHTNVYLPETIEQLNSMFGEYRIFLKNIEGRAIVCRTNLSKKDEIPIGSEIMEVNGKPTSKFAEENVTPYISSSTEYVLKDWSISGLLRGLVGEVFNLKIKKPSGQIIELKLTHKKTEETAVYPEFESSELLEFKWKKNQIAYLALNSFEDEKIVSLFIQKLPDLYNAKALIIDLRYNGGGNTPIVTAILKYLTNDKILYGAKYVSRLHIPTFKAWGKSLQPQDTIKDEMNKKEYLSFKDKLYYNFDYEVDTIKLESKRVVIPTVLLIGHDTASAAEDFLIYSDNQRHMTKIGENSFGSTGQPYHFELPGGGTARVCTKKDTYRDGREFVGYGIKPDIEVIPTLNDYLKRHDPAMEKAIEFLNLKLK